MASDKPNIAVVLPAYNEELTIQATIEAFCRALPDAEIYVINNNSTDQTALKANEAFDLLRCNGCVVNEPRQGKGNALRRAFHHIDADVYLLSDADLTYPSARARDLIDPILKNESDMVVGDRQSGGHYRRENKRAFHNFGNRLVLQLINWLFRAQLKDAMSGYRAFSRQFVKTYPILVEGFQVETDMTLHALHKRFRILEVPIEYKDRPPGSLSKLNTVKDGARVIITIGQILRYYRPLLFFGCLGFFFFFLGLIASMPVISDWIEHRYIYHVPLAVLSAALEVVATMVIGIGLILDALVRHHRMDYERKLLERSKST